MNRYVVTSCEHKNKALCHSPTTNFPLPHVVCMDCGDVLITVAEAARFVEQAATLQSPGERS